jgi:hypothetical protein
VYHQGEWTGINGQGKLNELTVFPNPSDGRLSIVTGRITKWDVKIFNSTGELVNSLVLPVNEGVADITELKPGLYYLLAQDGSRRIVRKIVIR